MSKVTSSPADYHTFPTLFELEPVAGFEDATTATGEALLRSALEKSRNLVPSDHLRVLPSGTSNGF